MEDFDRINNEFYDANADRFDKIPFSELLPKLLLKYLSKSPCRILEIGSGAGALALWLKDLGKDVVCVEPASRPAEMARIKGLNVHVKRFQDFQTDEPFDFIVAISSLIHIPKAEISLQINRLASFLQEEGVAFISFIEGKSEGLEDPTVSGKKRNFAKYSKEQLERLLTSHFTIIESYAIENHAMKQTFWLFVLKRVEKK